MTGDATGAIKSSRFQDVLGGLAATCPGLVLALSRLETRWFADELEASAINSPIYVCGLPRSGSTILLEVLAAHEDTASHLYRDFPLVHIPVWWNWFLDRAGGTASKAVERFHGDGIMVTPESPEAMEEMVWMAFFPDCHDPARSNVLPAGAGGAAFADYYRNHVRKLLKTRAARRYVAKGNYNVARLACLSALFPDARFVIPWRNPADHVASLTRQQARFSTAEARDPRFARYLQRVGHFEFGLARRPINLGADEASQRVAELWADGQEVAGWAAYWASVYAHVLARLEADEDLAARTRLVSFEGLCDDPAGTLAALFSHCGLPCGETELRAAASRIAAPKAYGTAFSDGDLSIIERETEPVLERLRDRSPGVSAPGP